MKMIIWAVVLIVLPASVAAAAAPPSVLAPYILDGQFQPHDLAWLRGAFPGSAETEQKTFAQINQWLKTCAESDRKEITQELSDMGVETDRLTVAIPRDPLCRAVLPPAVHEFKSFAELEAADASAKTVAQTFLYAVKLAEETLPPPGSPTELIRYLPFTEQVLRKSLGWGQGSQAGAPPLAPQVKILVEWRLGLAMAQRDSANTRLMKAFVETAGWPKISTFGKEASHNAWVIVQHADADPPFQLKALRMMEPLAASGEVEKANYAYLYDRVTLKITGKQRYGTQLTCRAGSWAPKPLEDEAALNTRRAEVGLRPISEYLALAEKDAGTCPPDPL
jgi:hypothetical protein